MNIIEKKKLLLAVAGSFILGLGARSGVDLISANKKNQEINDSLELKGVYVETFELGTPKDRVVIRYTVPETRITENGEEVNIGNNDKNYTLLNDKTVAVDYYLESMDENGNYISIDYFNNTLNIYDVLNILKENGSYSYEVNHEFNNFKTIVEFVLPDNNNGEQGLPEGFMPYDINGTIIGVRTSDVIVNTTGEDFVEKISTK